MGGVDACLFVVAATEGWKPQSEEHLRILELVGVRHGVVALTKVDVLDDPDLVELAALEVADHVAGTFLAGAPVVPVAAPLGRGVAELAAALGDLARHDAGGDRSRPGAAVGRPGVRGEGQRHGRHRHVDRRPDRRPATSSPSSRAGDGAGAGRSRRSAGRSARSGPGTAWP